LLALIRHIPAASQHVAAGGWDRNLFKGNNLSGKKLGILGFGRVGKQVAGYAKAFGMAVQACDPYSGEWMDGVKQLTDAAQLFSQSDIISIHIPAAGNDGFASAQLLGHLKPHALLINTSRGSVWDETAVAALLENEKIAGVATDVIAHELDANDRQQSPLLRLAAQHHPRLIVTPHIAGATYESMHATENFVAEKWLVQFGNQS
jgi:D-3-phosphoglycerate dehydrogenase